MLFNENLNGNFITNKRKIHDKIILILVLVILPIYSSIVTHTGEWSGGNRAVYNSLSALAHVDGQLVWVLIWGVLNVGTYVYLFVLNTFDSGMNKYLRLFFIVCALIGFSLLMLSSIFPYNHGSSEKDILNKNLHNSFAHWGFGFVVVEFCVYTLTLFFRNVKQFELSFLTLVFVMTISLYVVFEANEKDISPTDISSIAQVIVFLLINAQLTLTYFTNRLFSVKTK